jgi:hypothetical protein
VIVPTVPNVLEYEPPGSMPPESNSAGAVTERMRCLSPSVICHVTVVPTTTVRTWGVRPPLTTMVTGAASVVPAMASGAKAQRAATAMTQARRAGTT